MGSLQDALALLDRDVGNIADRKGKMMGCRNVQGIFFTHNTDLHLVWRWRAVWFGDTPVVAGRVPAPGGQYQFTKMGSQTCNVLESNM